MLDSDKIKEIVESQQVLFADSKAWKTREIKFESKLIPGYILVLTGVRRCGKSTLLKQFHLTNKNSFYLHFDDPRLTDFEVQDFFKVEKLYGIDKTYLFDEMNRISEWEKYMRHVSERKGSAIVTGSNANLISKEYGTLLTGRNFQIELFPLSYVDFLQIKNLTPNETTVIEYMEVGGFPEFLLNPIPEILRQYVLDLLYRDIISRYSVHNTEELIRLTMYLLNNISRLYSITNIVKMLGVKSGNTISTYISYLEDSYLLFSISLYDESYRKRLINNKKIYAVDTGLVNANTTKTNKDLGRLFENLIFLHLRKFVHDIFYYKDKFECDFIIRFQNQEFRCFQVCYHLNDENLKRELNGIIEAMDYFKLTEGVIITLNQTDFFEIKNKKIHVQPAFEWLLEPIIN